MAEKPPTDPAAVFRELTARWEKEVNATMNRLMGTDEFARSMGQATTASVRVQQHLQEAMERYLKAMNLPNRSEMLALGERLASIETKLDDIQTTLRIITARGDDSAKKRPARTRKPPEQGAVS